MDKQSTRELIRKAGGPTVVASWFGIRSQAVSQWKVVPLERCPEIEARTGGAVKCIDLRPDFKWPVTLAA